MMQQTSIYPDGSIWERNSNTWSQQSTWDMNLVIHTAVGAVVANSDITGDDLITSKYDSQNLIYDPPMDWIYGGTGGTESNQGQGQSFTIGSNDIDCVAIVCRLAKFGSPTDNLDLKLRSTSISGTVLSTVSIDISTFDISLTWIRFEFSSPVTLTASTKYYFTLERSGARDIGNYALAGHSTGSDYSGGGQYTKSNNAWGSESGTEDLMLKIESSSLTMPATAEEIDSYIVTA